MRVTWKLCIATCLLFANAVPARVNAETIAPEKAIQRIEAPRDKEGNGNARKSLEEIAIDYGVPGFAIAVIDEYEVAWVKAYGVADTSTGQPVTAETLFQAASISKPVAAMASMKAIQDGLFGLDSDVNTVLKSWRVPDSDFTKVRSVTPRMLMSHTSGTDDGFGFPGYDPGAPLPTVVQILSGEPPSNLKAVVWAAEPFTRMKYSGGAVMLEQLVLEDATGKPFEELARTWVLGPLDMRNSFYVQPLPPELDARAARSHLRKGAPGNVKYHVYPELAAAGLWTTPEDLCKFAIEVQKSLRGESNRVLNAASTKEMVTPVGVGQFGVGFSTWERGGAPYFGHGGGNWGVVCNLVAARDAGVGFAIMTNGQNGGPLMTEVEARLADVYDWPGYEIESE
jgi:CubicO group peptidase (beta-lactamase class C family)